MPELFSHLEKLDKTGLPLEVIVVNNLSTDSTHELAESFFQSTQITGKVVNENTPGLSFARKTGVLEAKYSVVLFCDDDNFFESDYLKVGFTHFVNNPSLGCLGGFGIPEVFKETPAWFDVFASSYALGSLGKISGIQSPGGIHYGAGLFFRTEALIKVFGREIDSPITDRKGESLSSGGDSELCLAVQMEGYELAYSPDLRFYHKIESNRVTEAYYLRLRKGILANFPILSTYSHLLDGHRSGFNKFLWRQFPPLVSGLIKTFAVFLIRRDFVSKVYFLNYWWKLKGLVLNYYTCLRLYGVLKTKYNL